MTNGTVPERRKCKSKSKREMALDLELVMGMVGVKEEVAVEMEMGSQGRKEKVVEVGDLGAGGVGVKNDTRLTNDFYLVYFTLFSLKICAGCW
jgi:hypothetical protein